MTMRRKVTQRDMPMALAASISPAGRALMAPCRISVV
jgi:hypothetical protein